jgi:hypothetical protein
VQRLCPIPQGVNAYLADPAIILSAEHLECGFCATPHRLWRHGTYHRQALFPGSPDAILLPVIRLLCAPSGRTVSLLPDFCLPRRQHGPAILILFLAVFLLHGLALLPALREARPDAPGHSVAQSLLRGFEVRVDRVHTYLASIRPRLPNLKDVPRPRYRDLTKLVFSLIDGEPDPVAAFLAHARAFHGHFGLGIA